MPAAVSAPWQYQLLAASTCWQLGVGSSQPQKDAIVHHVQDRRGTRCDVEAKRSKLTVKPEQRPPCTPRRCCAGPDLAGRSARGTRHQAAAPPWQKPQAEQSLGGRRLAFRGHGACSVLHPLKCEEPCRHCSLPTQASEDAAAQTIDLSKASNATLKRMQALGCKT